MKPPAHELAKLQQAVVRVCDLQLVMVFGSVVRGTARPDSAIDIAVLAGSPLSATQKINLIETVANTTGRAVDLIDLENTGQPLLGEILRDGVRLIGSSDTQADLATQAVVDAEDFLPLVQRMLTQRRLAWTH